MEKKRLIVNFNSMSSEVAQAMQDQYPYGINEDDIQRLPKAKNEYLYVVPVKTPDADYLVKVERDVNIDFSDEDIFGSDDDDSIDDPDLDNDEVAEMDDDD